MHFRAFAVTTALPFAVGLSTLFYEGAGHVFWRAHAGDALIVAFLVGALGTITRWRLVATCLCVGVLSCGVELAQLADGAGDRRSLVRLLLGSTFDPIDFVAYGVGIALAVLLSRFAYAGQAEERIEKKT